MTCSPETTFSRIAPELPYTLPSAAPKAETRSQKSLVWRTSAVEKKKPVPLFSGSKVATLPLSGSRLSLSTLMRSARVFGTQSAGKSFLL